MKGANLYAILGINESASQEDVKREYRKLAIRYHPDKNPNNKEAEEQFKLVSEAYSILSDPQKRLEYDQRGSIQSAMDFNGSSATDLFDLMFPDSLAMPQIFFMNHASRRASLFDTDHGFDNFFPSFESLVSDFFDFDRHLPPSELHNFRGFHDPGSFSSPFSSGTTTRIRTVVVDGPGGRRTQQSWSSTQPLDMSNNQRHTQNGQRAEEVSYSNRINSQRRMAEPTVTAAVPPKRYSPDYFPPTSSGSNDVGRRHQAKATTAAPHHIYRHRNQSGQQPSSHQPQSQHFSAKRNPTHQVLNQPRTPLRVNNGNTEERYTTTPTSSNSHLHSRVIGSRWPDEIPKRQFSRLSDRSKLFNG